MGLVISRKTGDTFEIGGTARCPAIMVTVIRVVKGVVRLHIAAPKDVPIRRTELASVSDVRPTAAGPAFRIPRAVPEGRERTVSEVVAAKCTVVGCCGRFADNMGCDCLAKAKRDRPAAQAAVELAIGRRLTLAEYDSLFPAGTGCSICRDPNCDNQNGKH